MPKRQAPTVRDVASLAGTSTAVVSYVINDGPRPVADTTRQRVLDAIDALGYRPNRVAKALRSQRSDQLGLVVPSSTSEFFVQLIQDIERAAFAHNRLMLVGSSGYEADRERAYLEAFVDAGVDAVIVAAVSDVPPTQQFVEATRLVWIHHRPHRAMGPFVDIDDEDAGRLAMEHLLHHGVRRPLLVTGPTDGGPVGARLAGAQRSLVDHGLALDPARWLRTDFSRLAAARAVRGHSAPFDGVLTTTDEHGIGTLAALGRRVPDDVAVVSIDGTEASLCLDPSLTSVEPPIRAMAERAVALAIAPELEELHHQFEAGLRVGGSCGCGAASC